MNTGVRKCFRFFIMLLMLLAAASVMAQDEPKIQWEVVNPFRFIHDQKSIDELRDAYDELRPEEKTAQGLERRLQEISEKEVKDTRAKAGNCSNPQTPEAKKGCFEPYAGWFARIAEKDKSKGYYGKTCWDSVTRKFRTDVPDCNDYIYPKNHRVRVWIENARGLSVSTWLRDGQPLTPQSESALKDCDAKYHKAFCIEFPVSYDVYNPETTINISARLSDGRTIDAKSVKVVDKLIVGLGDSYAAGEGNPDIPARFTQGDKERDRLPAILAHDIRKAVKGEWRPKKDGGQDAEAHWLDRRCHRSMYSYQFKTALQLALSNRQQAITYVSYACSGATTANIFSKEENAREERGKKVEVQLNALREVLSNGQKPMREIDYLLLSAGGNDIKFAKYVIYALLSGYALGIYERIPEGISEDKLRDNEKKQEFKETLLGESDKKGNYFSLNEALLDAPMEAAPDGSKRLEPNELRRIRIKNCKPGGPCDHILLTPYPDILTDENGNVCQSDRKAFKNPFNEDSTRGRRIGLLDTLVVQQLQAVQKDRLVTDPSMTDPSATNAATANRLGWTVVQNNMSAYSGHGFCAQKDPLNPSLADKFELPRWNKDRSWSQFDPREYIPYTTRRRWVRIPIDAKLTTDQMHLILKGFGAGLRVDLLLEDDRSIIMHPTAEGLAKTADENLEVIRSLESRAN